MKAISTAIPDVWVIEPAVRGDERGFFLESYNRKQFAAATGVDPDFVQDNHSRSSRNVLRGLHYQVQNPQGKLVRVAAGEVFDVVVDLRRSSATLGQWGGHRLSAENKKMLWVPAGFAHGFLVLSDYAEVLYKVTEYYAPQFERSIVWNDSTLAIDWPLTSEPALSAKDKAGAAFDQAEIFD